MKKSTFKISMLILFLLVGTYSMAQFTVTFTVDMNEAEGFDPSTQSVYIAGDFIDWTQPGENPDYMLVETEAGSMIYAWTWEFAETQQIMYKYFTVADAPSWDFGEWTGDPNRTITPSEEVTLADVWNNKPSAVTINVDMTDADPFDPETENVYISGSVNLPSNWREPGSIAEYMMSVSEENEMVYSITLMLYPGDYMYKFFRVINDEPSWDNGEWTGDPNREIMVDTLPLVEDKVWGILSGIGNKYVKATFSYYPNPVNNVLYIKNLENATLVEVYNVIGELVTSIDNLAGEATINTSDLKSGVYFINVHTEGSVQTAKFLKN